MRRKVVRAIAPQNFPINSVRPRRKIRKLIFIPRWRMCKYLYTIFREIRSRSIDVCSVRRRDKEIKVPTRIMSRRVTYVAVSPVIFLSSCNSAGMRPSRIWNRVSDNATQYVITRLAFIFSDLTRPHSIVIFHSCAIDDDETTTTTNNRNIEYSFVIDSLSNVYNT